MRADGALQEAGDPGDGGAGEHRRRMTVARMSSQLGRSTRVRQLGRDDDGGDRAREVLPLAADVEQAAAEGECDGEPGQHEGDPQEERLLEVRGRDDSNSLVFQGNQTLASVNGTPIW